MTKKSRTMKQTITQADALAAAVAIFGSKSKMARALKVGPMVVQHWHNRQVPAIRAAEIERATGGKVTRAQLRPDLFL